MLLGKVELDVGFGDKTMKTAFYVKANGPNQLLLGEGSAYS